MNIISEMLNTNVIVCNALQYLYLFSNKSYHVRYSYSTYKVYAFRVVYYTFNTIQYSYSNVFVLPEPVRRGCDVYDDAIEVWVSSWLSVVYQRC